MPEPVTAVAAASAVISGGVGLLNYFGGKKAAEIQSESNKRAQDLQQGQFEAAALRNEPATNLLAPSIEGLQSAINAPQQNFQSFLQSQPTVQSQIGGLANQGRANVLASAEATGNLGGSSTYNDLLRINPELAFQLEDRNRANATQEFNASNALRQQNIGNLQNLTGVGLSGANQTNILGQNFASNQGNLLQQGGNIDAGGAQVGSQVGGQILTDVGSLLIDELRSNQAPAPTSASQGTGVN